LTSRTKSPDHSWHYVLAVLFVTLGVALMHASSCGGFTGAESHDALTVIDQDHPDPMATATTSPDPDPSAPVDPCHKNGEACCLSAPPSSAPQQLLALMVLAATVVIDATLVPLLQRVLMAHQGSHQRHPPDLSALCVLRI
jgi:Family of unknown function (DUF6153)